MLIRGATMHLGALILVLGMWASACSSDAPHSRRTSFTDGAAKKNPSKSLDPAESADGLPKPKKKPPPKEPDPVSNKGDAPIDTGNEAQGDQMLSPVDVYCSDDTVKYNGNLHFMNAQNISFRFYNNSNKIYRSSESISAQDVRDIFEQSNAFLMPGFTGLPDGQYDLLLCEESKLSTCFVDFNAIFEFTPYEAVYYGKARGLVGIVRKVDVVKGRFANFEKLSLIYPATGHAQTCTTEVQ